METFKIVLAMLALVLIGFIGGFATHRHLTLERIHETARKPGANLERHFQRVIDADDTQREQINTIIEKWNNKNRTSHDIHRKERTARIDSMVLEMQPHLNAAQKERVQETLTHLEEREKRHRRSK